MRVLMPALMLGPTPLRLAHSADNQKDDRVLPAWYTSRMKQWDSLLHRAGQHKQGLVLEARFINDALGVPWKLMLGVRNVGEGPVRISVGLEGTPILLIRDDAGRPVLLTTEGKNYYNQLMTEGSVRSHNLTPGEVMCRALISLDEHFILRRPGRYTVLAIAIVADVDAELIARPVTIELPKSSLTRHLKTQQVKEDKHQKSAGGVADEWAALEAEAGSFHQGYVLEADISPVHPEAMNLVVSLINGPSSTALQNTPFFASDALSYHILVRDPSGKLAAVNEAARRAFVVDKNNHTGSCSNVWQGWG